MCQIQLSVKFMFHLDLAQVWEIVWDTNTDYTYWSDPTDPMDLWVTPKSPNYGFGAAHENVKKIV